MVAPERGRARRDRSHQGRSRAAGDDPPLVWSHTTSGTNRALFVTVTVSADPDTDVNVTSVQYGEASLSLVMGSSTPTTGDAGYTTLWAVIVPRRERTPVTVTFTGLYLVLAGSISSRGSTRRRRSGTSI